MENEGDIELVKMSNKGQLVVPFDVRQTANLTPGERFMAFPVEEGVLFKKVNIPKVKLNFNSLAKEIEAQFKKNNISKSDVKGAIRWARKK
jgi:bifunctional DNA-binding transcriptional regulator/antitoxin component of YhaV-PrlF toxin-antitoxin module